MKKLLCALGLLLTWNTGHAGWVMGKDSDSFGMLKVFQDGEMVALQHCRIGENGVSCQDIVRHDSVTFQNVVDHAQIMGAVGTRILSGFVGMMLVMRTWNWRVAMSRLEIVLDLLAAGGLMYMSAVPVVDALDFERLNNYRKIYGDEFLNDEDAVIILPDDSINEIMKNLGYPE